MSNKEQLEKKIFDVIVKEMDLTDSISDMDMSTFTYDKPIFSSMDETGLALDSVEALELVVILEKEFDISVTSMDFPDLASITQIAKFIRTQKGDIDL